MKHLRLLSMLFNFVFGVIFLFWPISAVFIGLIFDSRPQGLARLQANLMAWSIWLYGPVAILSYFFAYRNRKASKNQASFIWSLAPLLNIIMLQIALTLGESIQRDKHNRELAYMASGYTFMCTDKKTLKVGIVNGVPERYVKLFGTIPGGREISFIGQLKETQGQLEFQPALDAIQTIVPQRTLPDAIKYLSQCRDKHGKSLLQYFPMRF